MAEPVLDIESNAFFLPDRLTVVLFEPEHGRNGEDFPDPARVVTNTCLRNVSPVSRQNAGGGFVRVALVNFQSAGGADEANRGNCSLTINEH